MSSSSQIQCGRCEKCGEYYGDDLKAESEWCKSCLVKYLKENFVNWTSGNEKIDNYIQEMQLKINNPGDIVLEWIPYNQFYNIIEDVKCDSSKVYSAIWKDGPLSYSYFKRKLTRVSSKKVALKCLFNLQNNTNKFLNEVKLTEVPSKKVALKNSFSLQDINTNKFLKEVKTYSVDCSNNILKIYGISQNPDTKDYIMVLHNEYFEKYCKICCSTKIEHKWCNSCHFNLIRKNFINCNSGNKEIDNYIQEMQLSISNPCTIVFEWIPYDQFSNINEIGKDDTFAVYSATWKDGPLHYECMTGWAREPNKKVALKCLQNATNEFLNEVKTYSINYYDDNIIYGVSQNLSTKDYVMVLQDKYHEKCVKCGKTYIDMRYEWYSPCQINHFRNEKIDSFIQKARTRQGGFSIVYSAIWKDGPLYYLDDKKEWIRKPNKKFALKCLHDSQNSTDAFLNEVKALLILDTRFITNIYGISQDPDTQNYIMILDYAGGGNFNNYLNKNLENFDWFNGLKILTNIIEGLDKIHQKQMVHRDLHTGNILISTDSAQDFDVYISDMGLCDEVGNIDNTKVYGVMPYVAPEVLKGKPYTQSADIYSFSMIMYFVATAKQPFANSAHDHYLALNVCNGIRPEVNEKITPKCYIDLMKKCWDTNPDNRPNTFEIKESIYLFYHSLDQNFKEKEQRDYEIEKQFKVTEVYRKENFLSFKNNQSIYTYSQAIYTSGLLNPPKKFSSTVIGGIVDSMKLYKSRAII
ncbi:unnamed protein product [Rhizophagus irregularis]|nr:unnamed protein product [Rhizophagus irregularis]